MKGLAEWFDRQSDEVWLEDALLLALHSRDQLVDAHHLDAISGLDRVHQVVLQDHGHRHRQQTRRGTFR